jgi:hypothetical protein
MENKNRKPGKPKYDSILKTHKVIIELLNSEKNVDDVCNEFTIAKSTYYRVSKWLTDDTMITLQDKENHLNSI